jgi:hypothetical protein
VAARVLTALDADAPETWSLPIAEPDPRRGPWESARYYREHVLPWLQRRLLGRSSGDGRDPKHAEWHRVSGLAP